MQKINDPRQRTPQCHALQPIKTVHRNPWFTVRNRGGYFTVEYNTPQVTVLPIVADRAIVMVRVKRPVLNDVTLELPAGGVKAGETPWKAARREMMEETGINIRALNRFEPLPLMAASSARYPILPYLFRLRLTEQEFHRRRLHDNEIVNVECFRYAEAKRLIASGVIYVSFPVAIISAFLFRIMKGSQ